MLLLAGGEGRRRYTVEKHIKSGEKKEIR